MADDGKPPVPPTIRFTPNGTEFRSDPPKTHETEKGNERRPRAKLAFPDAEKVRDRFKRFARMNTTQEFNKAAKKDRDDFER